MVKVGNMEFASSIGVLYALKEANGCKTLQETYKLFESADMDAMIEILRVSYNKQNKVNLTTDQFINKLEEEGIGFLYVADIFQKVVEALMYDGLTPEQIEAKKKFLESISNK